MTTFLSKMVLFSTENLLLPDNHIAKHAHSVSGSKLLIGTISDDSVEKR